MEHPARWLLVLCLCAVAALASDVRVERITGELVTLETWDRRDRRLATTLWIVEERGEIWLRALDPGAAWVERLRARPEVTLTRGGVPRPLRAELAAADTGRIHLRMHERYGWRDSLVSVLHDPRQAVAIRLRPR